MKQVIETTANEQLSIFERELNVTAYCRVSIDYEVQVSSLDLQVWFNNFLQVIYTW